ncbi:peptidyl-prolyl cis-trans isomerase CYP37, chloroplastic [Aristolochia californica]|uniref:peptidyl-prolyl cis-trans isomerase CYP37, chloroplastic n=1 Tax=Aristolochia californica TaxID=171875 RepID=UPI0035D75CE9
MVCDRMKKKVESAITLILIAVQISSPIPVCNWSTGFISPAGAVLYSPDTKVPRTGELALRRAIPANTSMKAVQESLEDISYLLRIPQRKPYGTMEADVKKALKVAVDEKESILSSIPAELREKGSTVYASLIDGKGGLQSLIDSIKEKDPDKVSVSLASTLDTVAELELLQAPGLSFLLPAQYTKYPRLTGRGTIEFIIEKGDGSTFSAASGGEPRKLATIQVVIDGYSAPLTTGNFAKLVRDGAYDGVKLKCTNQAILSDTELGTDGNGVPLEIKPSGQFEPLYKTMLSVQDGELPVLPLSVYGAVAMAHSSASEEYSSPSQFFFYLYDKRNAGLGGLSFDEGQFSVFGYTTIGRDILPQIKTGDFIRSATLVEGGDRLILPDDK